MAGTIGGMWKSEKCSSSVIFRQRGDKLHFVFTKCNLITNYELRITNYELRITNYELRITN